jgi:hypothetical protein
MKRSTGLRNSMLATGSFKAALTGTVINIYSAATEPATADAALPGDALLLLTYSLDGTGDGVSFEATPSGGTLQKNAAEVWQGTIVASGTPLFFRMQLPSDANTDSTTLARLQGGIGLVDADLVVSSTTWTAGDQRKLNYFVASIAAG